MLTAISMFLSTFWAARAIYQQHRPWLKLDFDRKPAMDTTTHVQTFAVNVGESPALNITFYAWLEVSPIPRDPRGIKQPTSPIVSVSSMLQKDQAAGIVAERPLPRGLLAMAIAGRGGQRLFRYAVVTYEDSFGVDHATVIGEERLVSSNGLLPAGGWGGVTGWAD